jgi:hypothetical protein
MKKGMNLEALGKTFGYVYQCLTLSVMTDLDNTMWHHRLAVVVA